MKSVNESSNKESYTHIDNLLAKVPEVPADTIVSRSIYGDEGLKSTLFAFAPGQELSEHTAGARPFFTFYLERLTSC